MSGLGDELRSAREARRLSLTDVSEQIHIRSVYLQALEDENWSAISAPVYVRGFLRTYARFLGLNGDAAVERFSAQAGVPVVSTPMPVSSPNPPPQASVPPSVVPPAPKPRSAARPRPEPPGARTESKRPSLLVMVMGALAGVLVAFVAYNFYEVASSGKTPLLASKPGASQPQHVAAAPTRPPAPAPTKAPDRTLGLRLTQRSWVQVDIDGKPAIVGIFEKGWAKEFHGAKASVSVGNAGGVDVEVNGRDQGPMGADGDVVEKQFALDSGSGNGRG